MLEGRSNDVEHLQIVVCKDAVDAVSCDIGQLDQPTCCAVHEHWDVGERTERSEPVLAAAPSCAPAMRQLGETLLGSPFAIGNRQASVRVIPAGLHPQETITA